MSVVIEDTELGVIRFPEIFAMSMLFRELDEANRVTTISLGNRDGDEGMMGRRRKLRSKIGRLPKKKETK